MTPVPTPVAERLQRDLDDAAGRERAGDIEAAWRLLEDARARVPATKRMPAPPGLSTLLDGEVMG